MKTQLRKRLVPLLGLLALVMLIGACDWEPANSKVKEETQSSVLRVLWWGGEGRKERTLKAIAKFEEKYPHIKVEGETATFSDYWVQIAMKTADQNMPDVIQMDHKYIDEFTERKLLLPLDDLVKAGKLNLKNMDASSLEVGTLRGGLYGIVTGTNAPSFLYNPAVLEKYKIAPPAQGYTYEDLLKVSRELKKAARNPDFYPIGSASFDFAYYLRQQGASMYNSSGTGLGYDNDQYLTDFLMLQQQFIQEGLMAPDTGADASGLNKDSLIVKGLAAFHSITSNNVVTGSSLAGVPLKLMPLPSYAGGKEGNFVKPSMYFSISSYTKQADNAALFIDFFFNDLSANEDLAGERGVPATNAVRQHLMSKMKPEDQEQYVYMEKVQTQSSPIDPPAPLESGRVDTLFTKLKGKFAQGQITAQEAAKQFREGVQDIFAARSH